MADLTRRVRALAFNAVAPALDAYNTAHPDLTEPRHLPLSIREAIGTAVAEAVDAEIRRETAAEVERLREALRVAADALADEGAAGMAAWCRLVASGPQEAESKAIREAREAERRG